MQRSKKQVGGFDYVQIDEKTRFFHSAAGGSSVQGPLLGSQLSASNTEWIEVPFVNWSADDNYKFSEALLLLQKQ